MLSAEKVMDMFADYLAEDEFTEVVASKHGHVVISWATDFRYICSEPDICATPEELFDVLFENCSANELTRLTKGRREDTAEDHEKVAIIMQQYLDKRNANE